MIAELFLSTKVKTFLGILILYFIVIETDNTLHKTEAIKEKPKIETDTIQTKNDSLKIKLDKMIEKTEKANKQLIKVCNKKT